MLAAKSLASARVSLRTFAPIPGCRGDVLELVGGVGGVGGGGDVLGVAGSNGHGIVLLIWRSERS